MKTTWRQEIIPLVTIAAMFAAAAWSWSRVPDRLPIHWNAAGQADGFGGKFAGLMLLPIIAVGMYGLFFLLPFFDPGKRNYESFGETFAAMRTAFVLFFGVLYGGTLLAIHGWTINITAIVMPAVGVLFFFLGNVMSKIRPNHFVGIRTPWTLSSKESWNKTHRLGGKLFMAQGVLFMGLGILLATGHASPGLLLPTILGSTLGMICILLPYSYEVYARDPQRITPAGVTPANDDPASNPSRENSNPRP